MPLYIRPDRKLSVQDMKDAMRDHFEGTPFDMTQDIGGGKVTIHQDARLTARMGKFGEGSNLERINNVSYIITQGYRIQVFSGNDQRKSKQEATQKEKMIKEIDPQIETYITFNAPVWRLRVGNFRTYEEADSRLRLLKKELPKFGKEMYVVQDNVRFPIHDSLNASENK